MMKRIFLLLFLLLAVKGEAKRFFNLDLHVSVIADLKEIFESMGHEVVNWSISGHTWVFGKERDSVDIVNENTWMHLDAEMCDRFYERYKDFLSQFDGFIVTHTPSFALLYAKCNKPIFIVNSTRYEQPFFHAPEKKAWLDEYLKAGVKNHQIHLVSNNKADQKYLKEHTGLESELIPSLCLYTHAQYTGHQKGFIVHSLGEKSFKRKLKAGLGRVWKAIQNKKLPARYSWKELYDFKGIIHFPYQISTMSLFEQYSANIPLFVPSKKFLLSLQREYPRFILSQLAADLKIIHEPAILEDWIDRADYYDCENMPYIQYFDSFKDLKRLLKKADCAQISQQMKEHNEKRRQKIYAQWKALLETVM